MVEPMIAPVAEAMWSMDAQGIQKLEQAYAADWREAAPALP